MVSRVLLLILWHQKLVLGNHGGINISSQDYITTHREVRMCRYRNKAGKPQECKSGNSLLRGAEPGTAPSSNHLPLHWARVFVRFGWRCVASPQTLGFIIVDGICISAGASNYRLPSSQASNHEFAERPQTLGLKTLSYSIGFLSLILILKSLHLLGTELKKREHDSTNVVLSNYLVIRRGQLLHRQLLQCRQHHPLLQEHPR